MKTIEHFIDQQAAAEQEFIESFHREHRSFENPLVTVNPYGIAPLTAVIAFFTEEKVSVSITVKGMEASGDIAKAFPEAYEHVIPVLGLYPGTDNTVELRLSDGRRKEIIITTGPLDSAVKLPESIDTTAAYMDGNVMFVIPAMGALPAAYDYRGDCRWYCTENITFAIKELQNGRFSIGSPRLLEKPYYTTGLWEMDLIGKIYAEYRLPGGYHHDQFEMEDGNLLILTQEKNAATAEDMCVLVDRGSGEIIKSWDYKKVLPQEAAKSGSWSEHDWFHNNAVWYDKRTNSLTLSGRHQDAVINIDFETGELNWIIGDPEGWPEDMVSRYFFTPAGEGDFDWQYEQHACMMLPDGDIMMFDNGHWRSKNKEHYRLNRDNFSRGVRYHIDTEKMTIEQVWQFGKERKNDFFSSYISNVEYYRDGYYLVHSGGMGYNHGVTCEELPVYMNLEDPECVLKSITVEIMDGELMYEMHLPSNYYRAEKMSLYREGKSLDLGKGRVVGKLGVTGEFDTEVPAESTGELLPESCEAVLTEEDDRIIFKAKFKKGQLVMLQLEKEDDPAEIHRYFISTSAQKFLAMCSGTFLPKDDREVTLNVDKEGLNGTFDVRVIIDDVKYETGLKIPQSR